VQTALELPIPNEGLTLNIHLSSPEEPLHSSILFVRLLALRPYYFQCVRRIERKLEGERERSEYQLVVVNGVREIQSRVFGNKG
jgi:hypothetical protein